MQTYKLALLTPPQIAAMDRLDISRQEQIKDKFGQPLVLSKVYYLIRDASTNFTGEIGESGRKLEEALYTLLQKKGFFGAAALSDESLQEMKAKYANAGRNASMDQGTPTSKFSNSIDVGSYVIVSKLPEFDKSVGEVRAIEGQKLSVFVYFTEQEMEFAPGEVMPAPQPYFQPGQLAKYRDKIVTIRSRAMVAAIERGKVLYKYDVKAADWSDSDWVSEDSLSLIGVVVGRKRDILLPNGERHMGRYAIFELDAILASHNEETFADTKGYPKNSRGQNMNDRNYATDKAAQQLVEEYARNLNPDLLLSVTSGPEGTPIVTESGIVVSGNNRTMSMNLARKKYPEKWKAYVDQLLADFDLFGFPETMKEPVKQKVAPVLVRIDYDFGEMTTTNMAKYNASTMKAKSPVDRAAELATTLREQVLCEINIPEILGEFDTLGDFYADRTAVNRMVKALQQCSVLNEQDLPAYVDGGLFTEDGKTMLETVLASIILEPDAIRVANRDGVRSLRQVVVNALPVLIQNKNLPPVATLIPFVNQAIMYQGELVASGLPWADFVNQPKLFEQAPVDTRSIYLNRLMASGPKRFRDAMRRYNESQASATAGQALFSSEIVTPEDAFKGYIIAAVPESDAKLIGAYFSGSTPSQKFSAGDKVVSLKDGTQGVIGRMVTNGNADLMNSYSVKTNDDREAYWYEDEMVPLASIEKPGQTNDLEQKLKTATTSLRLLQKALPRLEGTRKKTAETEIKLLTRFLEKNKPQ